MLRPIGILDSGVGGLTITLEIMKNLPNEDIIYIGDTERCPYGSRSSTEIIKFTIDMVNFLIKKNIKFLIIACNTATAFTLDILKKQLDIPVIGVIQPGARAALKRTSTKKIAIIATDATIRSNVYVKELKSLSQDIQITSLACPLLVPVIEKGEKIGESDLTSIVSASLKPLRNKNFDTLILGCTHYSIIENIIAKVIDKKINIVSSGEETAKETIALLNEYRLINTSNQKPSYQFYSTSDPKHFIKFFNILPKDILLNSNLSIHNSKT